MAQLVGGPNHTAEVQASLQRLAIDELVSSAPGGYRFRHALVREASYRTLTHDDRRKGHRLAAQWLSRRETAPRELAEHFAAGDMPEDAGHWYARAVRLALHGNDLEQTLALCQQALSSGCGEHEAEVLVLEAEAHTLSRRVAANGAIGGGRVGACRARLRSRAHRDDARDK